jgi:hypothetical protein
MKTITNLNLLDTDKIIIDDEDRIFVILGASCSEKNHTCDLSLMEINDDFTKWGMTLPIACNKDMVFVSVNDKDWTFKFTETNVSKKELAKVLRNEIRTRLDKALKSK